MTQTDASEARDGFILSLVDNSGPTRLLLQVACGLALAALALPAPAGTNLSAWVFPGASGRLHRQPDALGNRLLDYNTVGYQGGGVPIPDVPVRVTISPVAGDNTANIQDAINAVKVLPQDTNGFRGAVMLAAGEYPCAGTITINARGIVLRGASPGTNAPGGSHLNFGSVITRFEINRVSLSVPITCAFEQRYASGSGRWGLRAADSPLTNALLSTTDRGSKLTKAGTNQVSLAPVRMAPALGEIEVREGILSVEKPAPRPAI